MYHFILNAERKTRRGRVQELLGWKPSSSSLQGIRDLKLPFNNYQLVSTFYSSSWKSRCSISHAEGYRGTINPRSPPHTLSPTASIFTKKTNLSAYVLRTRELYRLPGGPLSVVWAPEREHRKSLHLAGREPKQDPLRYSRLRAISDPEAVAHPDIREWNRRRWWILDFISTT